MKYFDKKQATTKDSILSDEFGESSLIDYDRAGNKNELSTFASYYHIDRDIYSTDAIIVGEEDIDTLVKHSYNLQKEVNRPIGVVEYNEDKYIFGIDSNFIKPYMRFYQMYLDIPDSTFNKALNDARSLEPQSPREASFIASLYLQKHVSNDILRYISNISDLRFDQLIFKYKHIESFPDQIDAELSKYIGTDSINIDKPEKSNNNTEHVFNDEIINRLKNHYNIDDVTYNKALKKAKFYFPESSEERNIIFALYLKHYSSKDIKFDEISKLTGINENELITISDVAFRNNKYDPIIELHNIRIYTDM